MKDAFDKFVDHIQTIPECDITLEGPIGLPHSLTFRYGTIAQTYTRKQVNDQPDIFWRDRLETAKTLGRLSVHQQLRGLKAVLDEVLK